MRRALKRMDTGKALAKLLTASVPVKNEPKAN